MYDICTLEIDFDFQIFDISVQSFKVFVSVFLNACFNTLNNQSIHTEAIRVIKAPSTSLLIVQSY